MRQLRKKHILALCYTAVAIVLALLVFKSDNYFFMQGRNSGFYQLLLTAGTAVLGQWGLKFWNLLGLVMTAVGLWQIAKMLKFRVIKNEHLLLLAFLALPIGFYAQSFGAEMLFCGAATVAIYWLIYGERASGKSVRLWIGGGLCGLLAPFSVTGAALAVGALIAVAVFAGRRYGKKEIGFDVALLLGVLLGLLGIFWAQGWQWAGLDWSNFAWRNYWRNYIEFQTAGTVVAWWMYGLLYLPILAALVVGGIGREIGDWARTKFYLLCAASFGWLWLVIWLYTNREPAINVSLTHGLLLGNPLLIGWLLNYRALCSGGERKYYRLPAVLTVAFVVLGGGFTMPEMSWGASWALPLLSMMLILSLYTFPRFLERKTATRFLLVLLVLSIFIQVRGWQMLYRLDAARQQLVSEVRRHAQGYDLVVSYAFFVPQFTPELAGELRLVSVRNEADQNALMRQIFANKQIMRVLQLHPGNRDYRYADFSVVTPDARIILPDAEFMNLDLTQFDRTPAGGATVGEKPAKK